MHFELIIKKLKNQLSVEEAIIFRKWYNSDEKHREYFNKIRKDYYKNFEPIKTEEAWKLVVKNLNLKKSTPYLKVAIAASIIGMIGLFSFFKIGTGSLEPTVESSITSTTVVNEHGKVILTLSNGTDVALTSDGYINQNIKSNGSELIYDVSTNQSTNEIAYNYLSVPKGSEFFVQLSDGTKVWLNSESKLKYPVEFKAHTREVELIYGEAYFEVSPSTLHEGANFIVKNLNQTIEVLGTEFNLKAYKQDETITTTLVEGKVSIMHSEILDIQTLSPNQQATLSLKTNKLNIELVDTEDITAWRKGVLSFQNKSLQDIMLALSRWFDLEVHFEDERIEQHKFNGIFRKTQDIENILESIQKTGVTTFQIDGKKIFVKKNRKH